MSSFNQLAPSVPTILNTSNCFIFSNSSSGNALSVQQLGAGNVASFRTTTGATAMFINPAGNVGVGMTNPGVSLDQVGNARRLASTNSLAAGGGAYIVDVCEFNNIGLNRWWNIMSFMVGSGNYTQIFDIDGSFRRVNEVGLNIKLAIANNGTNISPYFSVAHSENRGTVSGSGGNFIQVYLNSTTSTVDVWIAAVSFSYVQFSLKYYGASASNLTANWTTTGPTASGTYVKQWDTSTQTTFSTLTGGKVGIGTTNPPSQLTVAVAADSEKMVTAAWSDRYFSVGQNPDPYSNCVSLSFDNSGTGGWLHSLAPTTAWRQMNYGAASHQFYFGAVGSTPGIVFDSNGRVGIGRTSPSYLLDLGGGDIRTQNGGNVSGAGGAINFGANVGYGPMAQIKGALDTAAGSVNDQGSVVFLTRPLEVSPYTVRTNLTERMRITSGGLVGIGTPSPVRKFQVVSGSGSTASPDPTIYISSAGLGPKIQIYGLDADASGWSGLGADMGGGPYELSAYFGVGASNQGAFRAGSYNGTTFLTKFAAYGTGTIQFNTYTTNGTLSVGGSNGTVTSSSDARLKSNVIYLSDDASFMVKNLKPTRFTFKTEPEVVRMGFIAQDVEQVVPEAVDGKKHEYHWQVDSNNVPVTDESGNLIFTNEPRYRGLDDRSLIAVLTKALQEQITRVDTLEARLAALEAKLNSQ